jgi:polyphosphate kinase 2 (PPK2 family)
MADKRAERIAELVKPLQVKPESKVHLAQDFDPGYKADLVKKKDGAQLLRTGIELLADYQERLAAQDTYGVLVCLQALDAGGKDGTIRHVMSGVNPQGVQVSSFKVPSASELGHDYLWRCACRLPSRGQPWYVIPADRKWFARICVSAVLVDTLMQIDPRFPAVSPARRQELLIVKGELEAEAPCGAAADPFTAQQEREQVRESAAQADQGQQHKKPEKAADQGA